MDGCHIITLNMTSWSYRMVLICSTGTQKTKHVVAGFIDQAWHRPRRPSEFGVFFFLNADSLRGVRGFLSHGGSPILLFLNHPAIFLGFPHLWKHTAPWSPCHRLHQVTKRRGDCKRTSPIHSNPSRGLIARGPFL